MAQSQFKSSIGNKHQITIPPGVRRSLSLQVGSDLLWEVAAEGYVKVTPLVSVPRTALPKDLLLKFEGRLGRKSSDRPFAEVVKAMRKAKKLAAEE